MAAFLRVVQAVARLGKRAVDAAYRNRIRIQILLERGVSVAAVVEMIRQGVLF